MIVHYFVYYNPRCDNCGASMAAERSDEEAEAAMRAAGWEKRDGQDICRLCLQIERQTGKLPPRPCFWEYTKHLRKGEIKMSDKKNMIEQAEAETEAEKEETLGTLLSDTVHCIRTERERIEERSGAKYNSAYESYSVLMKALEDKSAAEKDLKDAVKKLWDGVKQEDEDVILAFLGEIERVARESAMAWIHVAAIAEKAGNSV